jgi:hypothetical protein
MTGMRPPPTGGMAMPGSIPVGGQITPLDSARRSLNGRLPVVSFDRSRGVSGPGAHWLGVEGDAAGGPLSSGWT